MKQVKLEEIGGGVVAGGVDAGRKRGLGEGEGEEEEYELDLRWDAVLPHQIPHLLPAVVEEDSTTRKRSSRLFQPRNVRAQDDHVTKHLTTCLHQIHQLPRLSLTNPLTLHLLGLLPSPNPSGPHPTPIHLRSINICSSAHSSSPLNILGSTDFLRNSPQPVKEVFAQVEELDFGIWDVEPGWLGEVVGLMKGLRRLKGVVRSVELEPELEPDGIGKERDGTILVDLSDTSFEEIDLLFYSAPTQEWYHYSLAQAVGIFPSSVRRGRVLLSLVGYEAWREQEEGQEALTNAVERAERPNSWNLEEIQIILVLPLGACISQYSTTWVGKELVRLFNPSCRVELVGGCDERTQKGKREARRWIGEVIRRWEDSLKKRREGDEVGWRRLGLKQGK